MQNNEYFNDIYIHNPDMAYPVTDTQHMVLSEKKHDYVYDRNFPYRLKGFPYNVYKVLMKAFMLLLAQPVCFFRYAVKVSGKENIKKYRALTGKKSIISVSNHSIEWDIIILYTARYFHFAEYPLWKEGAESSSGMLYRLAGGLVIPAGSARGIAYAYKNMDDVVKEGKWLHVFPEAACWPCYPAVRSFQTGAFQAAVENEMPVLPMAIKHRAPKGIYKLFKKHPNSRVIIGEPVIPDLSLPKRDAIEDLTKRSRQAVMKLLSINSEEQNQAIRDYFKTY